MRDPEELFCHRCGARFAPEVECCPRDGQRLYPASVAARIGQRIDNYELIDILGEGAMAVVYRAEHVVLGKTVAVKVLKELFAGDEPAAERFLREARSLCRLQHPNVVAVTDCDTSADGAPYFVMEYLEGETLEQALSTSGTFPLIRAVGIVLQTASALAAAHAAGIVHRDLKPANIFLSQREDHRRVLQLAAAEPSSGGGDGVRDFVKLLDFGVAKVVETAAPSAVKATRAGLVLGTPAYMAPEQIANQEVDPRTDIYALGVVFYELVTGTVPFDGTTLLQLLNGHLHDAVEPPAQRNPSADLDRTASLAILRCLEKRPEDRFQSAEDLCLALASCLVGPDRTLARRAAREITGPAVTLETPAPVDELSHQSLVCGALDELATSRIAPPRGRLTEELAALFAGETDHPSAPATDRRQPRRRPSLTEELAALFRKRDAGNDPSNDGG